jgi:hypothetical protein
MGAGGAVGEKRNRGADMVPIAFLSDKIKKRLNPDVVSNILALII